MVRQDVYNKYVRTWQTYNKGGLSMRKPIEGKEVRIQPIIEASVYDALLMIRAKEKTTIADIVNKAVKEYAERNHPDIIQ